MRIRSFFFVLVFLLINCHVEGQTIESIQFTGLKKTKEKYLLKILNTEAGETYNPEQLEKEMNFLKRMPGINQASYRMISTDSIGTLIIDIEESISVLPDTDLRHADGLLTFRLGVQEFNFLGRGIQLKPAFQYNGKPSYYLNGEIPYAVGNIGFSTNLYSITSDEPFYLDNGYSLTYEFKQKLAEFGTNWRPDFSNKLELAIGYIDESFRYVGMQQEFIMPPELLAYEKYLIRLNHQFDKRKWNYFRVSGLFTDTKLLRIHDWENDIVYFEFSSRLSYFRELGRQWNIGSRVQFGLATNNDSPISPFVYDSHQNIRGIGDRSYRGTGVLVWNLEARRTLFENQHFGFQAVVFSDLGNIRMPGESFKLVMNDETNRWHVGVGLRFIYKKAFNSVIRLDYGYGLDAQEGRGLVLGLGQYF